MRKILQQFFCTKLKGIVPCLYSRWLWFSENFQEELLFLLPHPFPYASEFWAIAFHFCYNNLDPLQEKFLSLLLEGYLNISFQELLESETYEELNPLKSKMRSIAKRLKICWVEVSLLWLNVWSIFIYWLKPSINLIVKRLN